MSEKSRVRYRLYVLNPETGKWNVGVTTKHFKSLCHSIAMNIYGNSDYYTDGNGKKLKLRAVAESVKGKEVHQLEEYKITPQWKVYGHFTNWENMGKENPYPNPKR